MIFPLAAFILWLFGYVDSNGEDARVDIDIALDS